MRRQRQKPRVLFKCLTPAARAPELFLETEASFTLFSPEKITAEAGIFQISMRVSITIPDGHTAIVQQHPFAMAKSLLVFPAYPITALTDGSIQLSVVNLPRASAPVRKWDKDFVLVDVGQPLAILTVVRAPFLHADFHGFDSPEEEHG